MRSLALAVLFALPALMCGCTANPGSSKDGRTGSTGPGIRQTCLQTLCDECTSSANNQCNSCFDTCDTIDYDLMAECLSTCNDICSSSTDCSSECQDDSCYQTGFEVTLPDKPDAKLKQACKANDQLARDCNYILPDCDAIGRAIVPEEAKNYTCEKDRSCGDASCPDAAPPGTLGDDICKACSDPRQCTSDVKSSLNAIDGVLVPSMHEALHSCLRQSSCSDAWDCVDTFFDTLYPGYMNDYGH